MVCGYGCRRLVLKQMVLCNKNSKFFHDWFTKRVEILVGRVASFEPRMLWLFCTGHERHKRRMKPEGPQEHGMKPVVPYD